MNKSTSHEISDEVIEHIENLSKLKLDEEQRRTAKRDMSKMLEYIQKMDELDTAEVEPMTHIFPVHNVFREDIVLCGDESEKILQNAPVTKDNMFVVPKAFT